jgi:hypothetical protein
LPHDAAAVSRRLRRAHRRRQRPAAAGGLTVAWPSPVERPDSKCYPAGREGAQGDPRSGSKRLTGVHHPDHGHLTRSSFGSRRGCGWCSSRPDSFPGATGTEVRGAWASTSPSRRRVTLPRPHDTPRRTETARRPRRPQRGLTVAASSS